MNEREKFESWMASFYGESDFERNEFDAYCDTSVVSRWAGWQAASKAAIPDGYCVVPKVPTEHMMDCMRVGSWKDYPSNELCRVRYTALLSAAQTERENNA